MAKKALIDAGKLTKPATVLIEKISNAIGIVYEPTRIRRKAIADANASKTKAISDLEINDIEKRALNRLVIEETKKQENIESITNKSLTLLEESARPKDIEDDWISNFFDKCKLISDDEMQEIWANILSRESNIPGTYSRRTINLLADFDKNDAELFINLCKFICIFDGEKILLIYDDKEDIYQNNNLNFSNIKYLESIGLIQVEAFGFQMSNQPREITITYFDKTFRLKLKNESNNNFSIGKVYLTAFGRELLSIINFDSVDGFYEYLIKLWEKEGYIVDIIVE